MIALSAVMVIDPDGWSHGIVKFSRMTYFHGFEIASRLFFGVIFIAFSEQTRHPAVMGAFGYLMLAASIGLLVAGSSRHKQFAIWSAGKFRMTFRPAGIASIVFGVFIVYSSMKGP
jgi:hypothetical protein